MLVRNKLEWIYDYLQATAVTVPESWKTKTMKRNVAGTDRILATMTAAKPFSLLRTIRSLRVTRTHEESQKLDCLISIGNIVQTFIIFFIIHSR